MKLTHIGPGYNWDGWPSSGGYTISGCNQPTRSTQPCIPPGSLNRVPASAGVKAGMSPLPGGRWYCVIPYGTWVPVAVRLLANCYALFTVTFTFTTVSPTKTAEPTEIPFGLWTRVGPGYHVLDGSPDSPGEWAILRVPPFEMHRNSKFSEDGCIKCTIYILIYLQTVLGLSSIQAI